MNIHVFGYPSDVGGAATELWHLVRLWRRRGVEITLVPTWSAPVEWRRKTAEIGCNTLLAGGHDPKLPDGSLVVALSNAPFLELSSRLRNCRIVYLPCMNYLGDPLETQTYLRDGPFAAYVFQSRFQRERLLPGLTAAGVPEERCHVIRGAFLPEDFPFVPRHRDGGSFVFGRVSRPDPRKFRRDWWQVCETARVAVEATGLAVACRTLGWHPLVARKCGAPPAWCEVLPKCAERVSEFLGSLDALIQLGEVEENWPRVGLEAMSAGVPVLADRRGGWLEMLEDRASGFLVGGPEELTELLQYLARHEDLRLEVDTRARQRVLEEFADEETLWEQWRDLLYGL